MGVAVPAASPYPCVMAATALSYQTIVAPESPDSSFRELSRVPSVRGTLILQIRLVLSIQKDKESTLAHRARAGQKVSHTSVWPLALGLRISTENVTFMFL